MGVLLTLNETKHYLRVDNDEDDALISSLIITSRILTEEIIRCNLDEFEMLPDLIKQAMLIIIGTLYEERQVEKNDKEGLALDATLDLVKKMLFMYRKEKF
jgi:uncharacterized phage protein (predicted DNA packaging)